MSKDMLVPSTEALLRNLVLHGLQRREITVLLQEVPWVRPVVDHQAEQEADLGVVLAEVGIVLDLQAQAEAGVQDAVCLEVREEYAQTSSNMVNVRSKAVRWIIKFLVALIHPPEKVDQKVVLLRASIELALTAENIV